MILEPWLLWGVIGITSGCVLGLAGAGGGIFAIPVLIYLGGYNVKDATGYALIVISIAALITWFPQRRNTNYAVSLTLLIFALIGASISAPWKALSPTWVVITILNMACLLSLYNLWGMKPPPPASIERHTVLYSVTRASSGGFLTGVLTTMTGLGGGVLMVPWLTAINRLSLSRAVACSLLTIALSAPYSAYVQGYCNISLLNNVSLIGGCVLASFTIKKLMTLLRPSTVDLLRRTVLASVIIISMASTLSKLF